MARPKRRPFAPRLRENRELLGLTQEEVAERLGITAEMVRRHEKGVSLPREDYRAGYERLYGKSQRQLGLYTASSETSVQVQEDPTSRTLSELLQPIEEGDGISVPVRTGTGEVVFVSIPRRLVLKYAGLSAVAAQVPNPVSGSAAHLLPNDPFQSHPGGMGQANDVHRLVDLTTPVFRAIMAADPEYPSRLAEVPSLEALDGTVSEIRQMRISCDYATAMRLIPDTVRCLHARLAKPDWRGALRSLILVEEAAASIVRYLGAAPASALITERMRDAARRLDDPTMVSLAAFQQAHASSANGSWDHARITTEKAIDTLSVRMNNQRGEVESLGMLMLTAALACYGEGAVPGADPYLEEARRLANQTGDTMTLSLFFGPTNVSIWELGLEVERGDPERAIALARKIEPARVPQVQRQSTFYLDTGRAFWRVGRDDDALRMLMEAERSAPAQVYADPRVLKTARNIVERRPRIVDSPARKDFCERIGLAI